jgi:hypothetical protein
MKDEKRRMKEEMDGMDDMDKIDDMDGWTRLN